MKRAQACGIHAVDALLNARPETVVRLRVAGERGRIAALAARARDHGIAVETVPGATLDQLAEGAVHQGVVAEFRPARAFAETDLDTLIREAGTDPLVLVLDQVQDPHNLGACLRSAAAAGACAVIVPRDRAAGLTPAARKAAAGAAERLPLIEVTNLARTLERLKNLGLWSVGLAGEAEVSLYDTDLTGPLALVTGSEQYGLRRLTRQRCDRLARIPMAADNESLNASVAAGIALFEARRQRQSDRSS
ncbi:MAG: 23S rRNA (guanosine(2251)-2'-O)-methyltransferase RlmB [Wenzhouxiangellaceae bacterium]|nr:23S rRNA (guanosine(2251)-2'-O)-methyltransferase RlmB [Wenzhouxiangellaceae bacterium]